MTNLPTSRQRSSAGRQDSSTIRKWQQRRAAKRVRPGDGRALRRLRWWQLLSRALFHLPIVDGDGRQVVYTVDVAKGGDPRTGDFTAHLYLDGRHQAWSKLPAAFPVPGGTIEVAASAYGLKRCHYVTDDGTEQQLTPDPSSAEGRRFRLDQQHPALSRVMGSAAVVMLVIGLVLLLLQVAEPLSQIPLVAEAVGTFRSPLHLPWWLNVGLGLGAAAGSMDRALRLRYSWLDSAGN